MSCSLNSIPDSIQIVEPAIGSCFIADLTPNPFLHIQARLITWQIFQPQPNVSLKEDIDFFSPMPSSSVNVEPDCIIFKSSINVFETGNEAFTVAPRRSDKFSFTQKKSYPAKNVEPASMVAIGKDTKSLSSLGPSHADSGVQYKPRLIFEDNCLVRS